MWLVQLVDGEFRNVHEYRNAAIITAVTFVCLQGLSMFIKNLRC